MRFRSISRITLPSGAIVVPRNSFTRRKSPPSFLITISSLPRTPSTTRPICRLPAFATTMRKYPLIGNAGSRQIGLVVEEVLGKDEIVIKNLGEYLRRVKLFPGTTIAPDGSLILLIDLNRMVASEPDELRAIQASASAARVFAPGSPAV